jgi:uncharacterized membrane protein YoaK (UPF0700 family)
MRNYALAALLSFTGGFVDTAGFLGLQGLFTAHVTGNFVTLGATLVLGTHGAIAKLLALPEFALVVALVSVASDLFARRQWPAVPLLLSGKVLLLIAFFVLAVALGPFPDSDAPAALVTGFAGVAAMAVQNAVQRIHLGSLPPSTLMTGNTTQAVLDAVALMRGDKSDQAGALRGRFSRMLAAVAWFAAGCALAASLYAWVGFWCLVVPAVHGVFAVRPARTALCNLLLASSRAPRGRARGDNSQYPRAIYFSSPVYAPVMRGIRSQQKHVVRALPVEIMSTR